MENNDKMMLGAIPAFAFVGFLILFIHTRTRDMATNPNFLKIGIDWFPATLLFVFTVGLSILVLFTYIEKRKIQEKEAALNQINLTKKLNTLAKIKLHHIHNSYNNITNLVAKNEFEVVKNYTEETANLLSSLFNNWQGDKWTIASELKLLYDHYRTEEILGRKVTIIEEFDKINIDRILFLQDVFPMLLQNSIEYAFREKKVDCTFKIRAFISEDFLLNFEISDNGIASDQAAYIRNDRPERSLNLLKQRIENEFEIEGKQVKEPFTINADANIGTTINFKYPLCFLSRR